MKAWPVRLVCPRDKGELEAAADELTCANGHRYPVVDGIPVFRVEEERPTHGACWASLEDFEEGTPSLDDGTVDPAVQEVVASTCGRLYRNLVGRLPAYPIPELPLPRGEGALFLEVGCNWGRWCVAAARSGYRPVGIDPSLPGVRAAERVARQLGVQASYLVGDARRLPFPERTFDVVFSYSVFQHFAKEDALASFDEVGRVLAPGGRSLIQMANVYGLRSLWNQARERRFREPRNLFDVRYWAPGELRDELERRIGPTDVRADGFFTLDARPGDLDLLPRRYRAVVGASEALRRASDGVPALRYAADSLYADSRRDPAD